MDSHQEIIFRARYRLIGSAVLILLGIVGFTLIFETHPRSEYNKIKQIIIPDKKNIAPLDEHISTSKQKKIKKQKLLQQDEIGINTGTTNKHKSSTQKSDLHEPRAKNKPDSNGVVALALMRSSSSDKSLNASTINEAPQKQSAASSISSNKIKFIVQIGSYTDKIRANNVRKHLEKNSTLRIYIQEIENNGVKYIRVRAGPFKQRSEAEQAAQVIRDLNLSASIFTL